MLDVSEEKIAACRTSLKALASCLQDRVSHWRALPEAVLTALEFAQSAEVPSAPHLTKEVVETLTRFSGQSEYPPAAVASLRKEAERLRQLLRSYSEGDRLRDALHSTIEQHVGIAAADLESLRGGIAEVLHELRTLPVDGGERAAGNIEAALRLCGHESLSLSQLSSLTDRLYDAVDTLPAIFLRREPTRLALCHTRRFRIVIVEDEEIWRQFVLRSVAAVTEVLGPSFTIATECVGSVQEAHDLLLPHGAESVSSSQHQDFQTQTIAVMDMGLPADSVDAQEIRERRSVPRRGNGHMLLRTLRAYRVNVPTIILTAPPHLLDDQLRACELGVADYDYILKGPDREDRLVSSILRIVERGQGHRVELWESPRYGARIDGIPVPMGEMPFRTFFALCQLSHRSRKSGFTPEQILDQLDETFRSEYDYKRSPETGWERAQVLARRRSGHWWRPDWASEVANVMRLWAVQKRETGGDLNRALGAFRNRYDARVWRNALALLDLYRRAHPTEQPWQHASGGVGRDDLLATAFEAVFGGLMIDAREDYDLGNIERHVHEIRSAIHAAFNSAHRYVEPRRELLVRLPVGDKYGYRVLGDIVLNADLEDFTDNDLELYADVDVGDQATTSSSIRRYAVLVVENEQHYRDRIQALLEGGGFVVRAATNVDDAVLEARAYQPDIICLDLHIPATWEEFQRDPNSGENINGLRALERIQQELGSSVGGELDLRVLIPTTLSDQDELREHAARLGVPISNFVPKGVAADGAPWEGHLLLTAGRMRKELETRSVLPALPPWRCPVVRIESGSDLEGGRLRLVVNGQSCSPMRGNQGKFLAVLLRQFGESVSFSELDRAVYGRDAVGDERKNLLKNVRAKIRSDWLRLTKDAPGRPELEVLESIEGGLILHAYVEGL